jgi:hypothetical protein
MKNGNAMKKCCCTGMALDENTQYRIEFGWVPRTEKNNMPRAAAFHVFKFTKKK